MAILNYTTKIESEKTGMEIQKILRNAKAQAILFEYDDDNVMSAMSFRINTVQGVVSFRLPANINGVYEKLKADGAVPRKLKTKEQAARVSWRILKNWVESQLAIVDVELAQLVEVFLPYAQDSSGKTLFEAFEEKGINLLTHG